MTETSSAYGDVEWNSRYRGRQRTRDGEVPVTRNTRITAENVKRTVTYWRSGK